MNRTDAPVKQSTPFAVNGQRESILPTTPAGDNTASYSDGFPAITMILKSAGGLPPKGQDMNQILYELSALARWGSSGAINAWDAAFSTAIGGYPMGAQVLGTDGTTRYISTTDSNATNPNTGGAGWFNLTTGYLKTASNLSEIAAAGPAAVAKALENLGLGSGLTGVVGAAINARMSVTAPSATATFTADELIVGVALGGLQYRLGSFNKTINLATTGAGGMDTGTAPVSGYVALYAIYNPTTAASAMLAVNATAAVAPQVYGGANMPAGYTASALISVWPTSSGSQFLTGSQVNRNINTSPTRAVLATSTQYPAGSTISIATLVPPNAVLVSGSFILTSSETSLMSGLISSDSQRSGEQGMTSTVQAFSAVSSSFSNISIPTSRMAGISLTSSAGTPSFSIYITCYSF